MIRPLALAAVLLAFVPAAAGAATVDVPDVLKSEIPDAAAIDVPVLLPSTMNLDYDGEPFADGTSRKGRYSLEIAGAPDCNGANACFLAQFTGIRGRALGSRRNVTLTGGTRGAYRPMSCGASCSPASIQWVQKGVRYEIQAKALGGRSAFVRMANSAIRAGNRG